MAPGKPLPVHDDLSMEIRTLSPNISTAYFNILALEKSRDEKHVMYARILGYLLLHGPSNDARKTVAEEVVSCKNDGQLAGYGKYYYDYYIRAFKKYKGSTPTASSHPSQPRVNKLKSEIVLPESPKSHEAAKHQALVRDGYHCHVTGNYERSVAKHNPEVERAAEAATGTRLVATQCAHIFDSSTNMNLGDEGSPKPEYAASVWAVMKRFGYKDIPNNLSGDKIHHLDNILTLDPTIRNHFDQLEVWLEPTVGTLLFSLYYVGIQFQAEQHLYKLEAIHRLLIRTLEKHVKFTTPDPVKYPLPSPLYLHIHATCAKIAHLSGAGEYIDKIFRDLDDIKVLSKDGASAELLEHLLVPWSHELSVY